MKFGVLLSFLSSRFTREYLIEYFNWSNFVDGMRSCSFRYKFPVLVILFSSLAIMVSVSSLVATVLCLMLIIASIFSLALVEV
jgi:accessory gene regulator protein AgrB